MHYVPLYIKTENTLLSSMIKINDLIEFAKKNDIKALTITDNNMYGVMEFYKACLSNSIKPIIGLEIFIDDFIVVLYAKNMQGYQNLIKINTLKQERKLTLKDLEKYNKELIAILPFDSRSLYLDLNKIYIDIFISYKNDEELRNLSGDNLIYMNETLYINESDKKYLPYLYAIRDGKKLDDIKNNKVNNYIKTKEEIENKFNNHLNNNYKIYDMCNLEIIKQNDLLPIYKCPDNFDSYSYLKYLCKEGLKKRFGLTVNRIYIDRLKYELDIINKMGFCNYFLVVADYVNYAKKNNILVGAGRGSAAGSLVSYCLNITDVDPIKYNLLFERFLNPERITMPDIDIDFEYDRREEVINYCMNKYGIKKVAGIITFGTLGSKQVIRDVSRVLDLSLDKVDKMCKMVDAKLSLKENYKQNIKLKQYLESNSDCFNAYKLSIKFEGLKRHISIHAAGIVMCEKELDDVIPIYKHESMYLTGYSMEYLEELGLLKMDFLSIKNLSTISNIIKEINKDGYNIDFNTIPLDDKKTIELFKEANTVGIFQFESAGMINFLRKFQITNFEDIVAALALYRPGPMNNIDTYIKRKKGLEKIDYLHEDLVNILKPTYGILIYQEQIMQVANVLANYSLGEADVLRRAMSKKKENILLEEKDKFISRTIANGYSEYLAIKVYELILKFASYGFNRSHSVGYGIIAYKMAYLKAHYSKYFMRCLLTNDIGSSIKTKEYINECKKNNINILSPDINKSSKIYKIEEEGIRYPINNIKGIGENIIDNILRAREKGFFKDIYDFIRRTDRKIINKKVLSSLIDAGCFDSFKFNHKTLQEGLDLIINYGELIKDIDEQFVLLPELVIYDEYSKKELMSRELEVFGFYLTNHPIIDYRLKYNNNLSLNNINIYFDKNIDIILYIDKIREINTKKGDKMCFITGSDEISSIDVIVFPKVYESINIKQDSFIKIIGKVERRYDKYQLIANSIEVISE